MAPKADAKGGDKKAEKKDGAKAEKKGEKKEGGKAEKKADPKAEKKGDKPADKKAEAKPAAAKPAAAAAAPAKDEKGKAPKGDVKDMDTDETPGAAAKARGPFRRFFYRGLEVHSLLDLTHGELMKLMTARVRRRFTRGQIPMGLVRKLRKEKNAAAKTGEKPKTVKTHHRNMIIVPEMVGSNVGVYNGLNFTAVEIKPDMIGHYLGEFALTYKPVKHGRPGAGATGTAGKLVPVK